MDQSLRGIEAPMEKVYSLTKCRSSKSDSLVPSSRKKIDTIRKSLILGKNNSSSKSVKSKVSSIVNIRNRRSRMLRPMPPLMKSGEFVNSHFGDYNDDVIKKKPIKVKICNKVKDDKKSNEINKDSGKKIDVESSMEGSAQITINFLREMDSFLQKQKELREPMQHNLKVQIKQRSQPTFPKEIPQILLKETAKDSTKINDTTAPDIIIKNYERQSDNTVAVQVVKFSPITNCLSVIPKIISNMSSGLFNRRCYPGNENKDSCQIRKS